MTIWQDANGALHDDMNGAALSLPSWPQGMTALTSTQVATIQAAQAAAAAAAAALLPNKGAFITAMSTALGGIIASNTLAVKYPLLMPAIDNNDWTNAQALISDANTTATITPTQYTAIKSAVSTYHIPMTLP